MRSAIAISLVSDRRRALLRSQLDASLDRTARARHETAGSALDAGTAVAEALERIEALAAMLSDDAAVSDVDPSDLTARQLEVAKLVAQGFTNKQIAQRLGISRFTAETHVRNILERLGAASCSEIATWATCDALADDPRIRYAITYLISAMVGSRPSSYGPNNGHE